MNEAQFETLQPKEATLPEKAAEQISNLIVSQHLTSEDKLPSEFELAESLNVGRGTIREAVKLLVARNVLEIRRGKGTYISENPGVIPDPLGFAYYTDKYKLATDLLEVRFQIEPWVAKLAAERATEENIREVEKNCIAVEDEILNGRDHLPQDILFHTSIAECTQNLVVPKLIPIITYSVTLFGNLTENRLKSETIADHRALLDALIHHDGEAAERAMCQHLEHNREQLIAKS